MIKYTLDAELVKLDRKILDSTVDKYIREEIRKGIKIYLEHALPRIPVRTGFLRGSFHKLVEEFEAKNTGVGQTGTSTRKKEFYITSKGTRFRKTPTSGSRFVTTPKFVIKKTGTSITVQINNSILYYGINDFTSNPRVASSPWTSSAEGYKAMMKHLQGSGARFPHLTAIMTKVKISSNGIYQEVPPDINGLFKTRELFDD